MAAGNQQKTTGVHFFFKSSNFLSTREQAYVRINISFNTWNGYTAENQEERLFTKRQNSYFGVTHCEGLMWVEAGLMQTPPKFGKRAARYKESRCKPNLWCIWCFIYEYFSFINIFSCGLTGKFVPSSSLLPVERPSLGLVTCLPESRRFINFLSFVGGKYDFDTIVSVTYECEEI